MTQKRLREPNEGATCKRLHVDSQHHFSSSHRNVVNLTDLDTAAQYQHSVNIFLRRVGVCTGVHAASDAYCLAARHVPQEFTARHDWQGLTESSWRCCAELNVLMQHYHHSLSQLPLVAYQCWHRLANATAFEQLCKACHHTGAPSTWWQLQMTNHLVHSVLNDQGQVVISKSVLALHHGCPAWLQSWCSRWGFTGKHISTLTLQPLAATEGCSTDYDEYGQTNEFPFSEAMPYPALYVPCTS